MSKKDATLLTAYSGGLLWFCASISLAELLTGFLIAPLGWVYGSLAIVLGHLIGAVLLFSIGVIGGVNRSNSMTVLSFSFGYNGTKLFSGLNALQLLGWTSVMIASGADAFDAISTSIWNYSNLPLWCGLLGVLIVLWLINDLRTVWRINLLAAASLFIVLLLIVVKLSYFLDQASPITEGQIKFGTALELSIMMPLSWLPLICDYTQRAKDVKTYTFSATSAYFFGSVLMYFIGFSGAYYLGSNDISTFFVALKLGVSALLLIVLSTVTTTYLDVFSASESFYMLTTKINKKYLSILITLLGTLIAITVISDAYENFLYFIGSVFAPAVAIVLTDYFILKKRSSQLSITWHNFAIWILGVIFYYWIIDYYFILGNTIPVMFSVSALCLVIDIIRNRYHV